MRTASVLKPVLQGLVVGIAATQALDVLSEVLYRHESPWLRFRENRTRGFLHAYERAIGNMAKGVGVSLSRKQKQRYGWAFHKVFGTMGGLAYLALRQKYPKIGLGKGLAFGAGFFAIADELLMPLLRLTPGPKKFSWKVHARGAVSHIAYGVAAELAAEAFDMIFKTPKALPASVELEDGVPAKDSRPDETAPAFYAP